MYEPVTTNCGHNFCRDCLVMWMQKKQKHTCPTCRNKIGHKWRMPINRVVWNAMLTMYPERLKKRKRDVELEISERPEPKKRRKINDGETTDCPHCGMEIKTNKLGLHLRLCNSDDYSRHLDSASSLSRGRRSATNNDQRSTRSGRKIKKTITKRNKNKKRITKRRNNDNVIINSGHQNNNCFEEERSEQKDGRCTKNSSNSNSPTTKQTDVQTAPSANVSSIKIFADSNGKQIGAIDASAVFHMKAGLDHLGTMEIRRLTLLNKPLSEFHPGVLSHMKKLHEAKITRGEIDMNDTSLLPKLEIFNGNSGVDNSFALEKAGGANITAESVTDNEVTEEEVENSTQWSMSNCTLQ